VTNNIGFWNGFIGTSLQLQSIITAHNQWLPKTRSIPHWTTSVFSSTVTDLVLIYESVTSSTATALNDDCLTNESFWVWVWIWVLYYDRRSVCLGIQHPFAAYDQIFITVRQLRVCWRGALSLTRRRVYRLQLLLALASAVIVGSESRATSDHILLSQIRNFHFRRLLRLAGIRWRYSTPPPHGRCLNLCTLAFIV
jgi:hypothetical protein